MGQNLPKSEFARCLNISSTPVESPCLARSQGITFWLAISKRSFVGDGFRFGENYVVGFGFLQFPFTTNPKRKPK